MLILIKLCSDAPAGFIQPSMCCSSSGFRELSTEERANGHEPNVGEEISQGVRWSPDEIDQRRCAASRKKRLARFRSTAEHAFFTATGILAKMDMLLFSYYKVAFVA